jgi:hypothetical protein
VANQGGGEGASDLATASDDAAEELDADAAGDGSDTFATEDAVEGAAELAVPEERAEDEAASDSQSAADGEIEEDDTDAGSEPPPTTAATILVDDRIDLGDATDLDVLLEGLTTTLDDSGGENDDDDAGGSISCPLPPEGADVAVGTVSGDPVVVFVVETDAGDRLAIVHDALTCEELARRVL